MIADKGYGRGPTYRFLQSHHIRAYIPVHDDNLGAERLSRAAFVYERRRDRFRCPQGHYLYPYEKLDKNFSKRYRLTGGHCRVCPLKEACLPQAHKHRARFLYRSLYQDDIDRMRRRQGTAAFRRRLRERQWKAEGLFAEAKQQHGLRRAKYRGRDKMQIQLYLTAIVQNTRRLLAVSLASLLRVLVLRSTRFLGLWRSVFSSRRRVFQQVDDLIGQYDKSSVSNRP